MVGTREMGLVNNDVISQYMGDTVREISNWPDNDNAETTIVHKWALRKICVELEYCWNEIKRLRTE